MRKLILLLVVAMAVWGGYWFAGATAVDTGLTAWFEDRRGEGWLAEYTALNTQGFPNRFDTTVEGLELADPDTGLAWSAPFFQIFVLSYKPNHIIAVWPDTQTIATPREKIAIGAEDMRGSLVFNPGAALELNRTSIVLDGMGFSSTEGWSSYLAHGQLAARQVDGAPQTYEIDFIADDLTPASEFLKTLGQSGVIADVIDGMSIEAEVEFTAPWDRYAVERARPQVTRLDLNLLKADWGQMDLWMAGEVTVDSAGIPTGDITVKAKNWHEMLIVAQETGILPAALAPTVEQALAFLSTLSGDKTTLDAPLTFSKGTVFLGPFPIAPAPRLVIR